MGDVLSVAWSVLCKYTGFGPSFTFFKRQGAAVHLWRLGATAMGGLLASALFCRHTEMSSGTFVAYPSNKAELEHLALIVMSPKPQQKVSQRSVL